MKTGIVRSQALREAGTWSPEFFLDPTASIDREIERRRTRIAHEMAKLEGLAVKRHQVLEKHKAYLAGEEKRVP